MSEPTKKVYHYTDEESKDAIEKTGEIKPSSDGAAGPGVYFTTIPPEQGRQKVSENNWDGAWNVLENQGRADHAFEVEIPENKLRKSEEVGDRDVLVHDGPVKLDDYKWKAMSKEIAASDSGEDSSG